MTAFNDYKEYYKREGEDGENPARKRTRFFIGKEQEVTKDQNGIADSFKSELESVLGLINSSLAEDLEKESNGDIQIAINLYYDRSQRSENGSQESQNQNQSEEVENLERETGPDNEVTIAQSESGRSLPHQDGLQQSTAVTVVADAVVGDQRNGEHSVQPAAPISVASPPPTSPLRSSWSQRYIGSFQAEIWATRSGFKLVQYQEKLSVERAPSAVAPSNYGSNIHSKEDFVVRISNSKGQDFARLSEADARIIALLIDTEVCRFSATCIYADTHVRIGSYIIIQVDCFILKTAFYKDVILPQSATRALGRRFKMNNGNNSLQLFDNAKENGNERIMRLRQLALTGLFGKLGFTNVSEDEEVSDDKSTVKRDSNEPDLVKATQLMGSQLPKSEENSDSDNDEDEAVVSQDDIDSLYKRSETPDTHLEPVDPPFSFAFELRLYQKKGLNWMIQKETPASASRPSSSQPENYDDNPNNEPMHPLWQSIEWPPIPSSQSDTTDNENYPKGKHFYANLYSGELSLKFPTQKKSVLGGILADEMGLGKTISTMALIHSCQDTVTALTNSRKNYLPNTTLVIAPMSLLSQWESEALASSHEGTVNVVIYYGSSASSNFKDLMKSNDSTPKVIITSYGTLVSQYNDLVRFRKVNGYDVSDESWQNSEDLKYFDFYNYTFHRIVLDEGHTIKNRNTKTTKACYELRSDKRWVLTGTPIVNKLEDLYSIVKFLGVEPWNNFNFWRSFITIPFQSKGYVKALNVVQSVMEPLVLRRTKSMKQPDGKPLVELPPKTITIEKVKFSDDEQVLYSYIFARIKSSFDKKLEQGSVMKSYTAILSQILRLRQTCCHPSLVWSKLNDQIEDLNEDVNNADINQLQDESDLFNLRNTDLKGILDRFTDQSTNKQEDIKETYGIEVMKSILEGSDKECPICTTEPIPDDQLAVSECWHVACLDCILKHIEFQKKKLEVPKCPTCRAVLNPKRLFQVDKKGDSSTLTLYRNIDSQSAKLRCLIASLQAEAQGANTKSVVFSQFTSYLDLIEQELKLHGIPTLRFDGKLSQTARSEVLSQFKTDANKRVLLISLKAGGVGLNLVCAQNAYMMDPWWSYAIESQAIDRIHRMGQTSEVKVIRYIIEGTVEERMLKIQDRKKFLASSTLGMSEEEKKAQRLDDIKMLFEE